MDNVIHVLTMIPYRLPGGFIADIYPADPDGFDLVIWRDECRDDGLQYSGLPDLRAVRRVVAAFAEVIHERS